MDTTKTKFDFLMNSLHCIIEMRNRMTLPDGIVWNSLEHIVRDNGQRYRKAKLPTEFKMGIPKHCFYNCGVLAIKRPDLVYVEGFAVAEKVPFPIHHAWLAKKGKTNVIEVTSSLFSVYYGIPFTQQYIIKKYATMKQCSSLLDDWENKFPCLFMTTNKLSEIIQK